MSEKNEDGLKMKYFVLKPNGNDQYARASREALFAYAEAIRSTNKKLSDDLFAWYGVAIQEARGK